MFFRLIAIGVALSSLSVMAEVNCTAKYRQFKRDQILADETFPIPQVFKGAGTIKFALELPQGRFMSATFFEESQEVLLMILEAPDYLDGLVTRSILSQGTASLAQTQSEKEFVIVDQNGKPGVKEIPTGVYTVYRIECYPQ